MTLDYNSLDIYFHMANHYNKLKHAKSLIDCAVSKGADRKETKRVRPTKSKKFKNPPPFTTACELNRRFCATSCACNNRRCCTPACLHTPIHSYGLKKHDCLTKTEKSVRSLSVPIRNDKTKTCKSAGRAKSVEPLVKRVPFSKFSTQRRNSGSSRSSRRPSANKDRVQSASPTPTTDKPDAETPRNISRDGSTCPRIEEHEYLHFLLKITEDILRNELYTSSEMQKVFDSHVEANKDHLDMKKMKEEIEGLKRELAESITKSRQNVASNFCTCDPKKEELLKRLENCECSVESVTSSCKQTRESSHSSIIFKGASPHQDTGRVSVIMSKNNEFAISSESVATSSEFIVEAEDLLTLSGSVNVASQQSQISNGTTRLYEDLNKEDLQSEGLEAVSEEPDVNDDPSMLSFGGVGGDLPGFENLESKQSLYRGIAYADASTSTKDNRPDEPPQVSAQPQENCVKEPEESEGDQLVLNQNGDSFKPAQAVCNYPTLLKGGTEPADGLKPAEIVFHTRSSATCHCNIAFRKVALKISSDESDPSAYVLIDGPVCLPKSLLETRGVPVLLENASSFFLDADGKVDSNDNYSKVDTLSNVNYLIDAPEIPIDHSGVSVSRQMFAPHQVDPIPFIESPPEIDNAAVPNEIPLDSNANKLLLDDYDLTPQRDEPGDKYHYLLRDATTSFHRGDSDEADQMWNFQAVSSWNLESKPQATLPHRVPRVEKRRVPPVKRELVLVAETELVPLPKTALMSLVEPQSELPAEQQLTPIIESEHEIPVESESLPQSELAPLTQNLLLTETYETSPKLYDNDRVRTDPFGTSQQLEQLFDNSDVADLNSLPASGSDSVKTGALASRTSNTRSSDLEYGDFLAKLDKLPTLKMTTSQEKQIAEITDHLKKFRELEEDEETAYRAYPQNGGEEELFDISKSLASAATTVKGSSNTQLIGVGSSTNQDETACCGMIKGKKKGRNGRDNFESV